MIEVCVYRTTLEAGLWTLLFRCAVLKGSVSSWSMLNDQRDDWAVDKTVDSESTQKHKGSTTFNRQVLNRSSPST